MDKVTELALKELGKKIEDLMHRTEIIELNLQLIEESEIIPSKVRKYLAQEISALYTRGNK